MRKPPQTNKRATKILKTTSLSARLAMIAMCARQRRVLRARRGLNHGCNPFPLSLNARVRACVNYWA